MPGALEEQLRGELLEGVEQSDQICVLNYHSGHFIENRLWWGQGWKHGSRLEGHSSNPSESWWRQ